MLETLMACSPPVRGVRRKKERIGGVPCQWFLPPDLDSDLIVVHFHGGGYCLGSAATHKRILSSIALGAGVRTLGVDYRLAPEHTFPAAIEDGVNVYRALLTRGAHPNRIAVCGDSAGGALAVSTMLRLRDCGDPLPRSGVLISPWVDLQCHGHGVTSNERYDYLQVDALDRFARYYLGPVDPKTPLASPIHADLQGLPPLLIQCGGVEIMLPSIARFAARASQHGVQTTFRIWEGMVHVWHAFDGFARIPEATEAFRDVAEFLRVE